MNELVIDNLQKGDYKIYVYPNKEYRKIYIKINENNIRGIEELINESDIVMDLKFDNEVLEEKVEELEMQLETKEDIVKDLKREIFDLQNKG